MPHHALSELIHQRHTDNLVIRCSDFRLREHLEHWTDAELDTADELVAPGAGLMLLREGRAAAALEDLRTLRSLHTFTDVWIVFHAECGAYRHFRGATDAASERAAQVEDMQRLQQLLADEGLKLHFRRARLDGAFERLDEDV